MNHAPDHSNYEAWLLDRLEGNLAPDQERALDAFLSMHPELAPLHDELPTVEGIAGALSAEDKDELKRTLPPTGMPTTPIDDFLIAQLEGDLTTAQEAALEAWLATHPEYARAARLYAATKTSKADHSYAANQGLKRELPPTGLPSPAMLADFLVARLEGDLNPEQDEALTRLLANNAMAQQEWRLMQRTRSTATAVVYPDKESLKKGGRVIALGGTHRTWITPLRMAASIALLIAVGAWWLLRGPADAPQVAHTPEAPQHERPRTQEQPSTTAPVGTAELSPQVVPAERGTVPGRTRDTVPAPTDKEPPHATPVIVPEAPGAQLAQHDVPPGAPMIEHQSKPEGISVEPDKVPAATPAHAVEDAPLLATTAAAGSSLSDAIAHELRTRVLENADTESGPLGGNDALAAVDKGLRVISGDRAGLDVQRNTKGGLKNFELRLGRNLAITASR